MAHFVPSPRRRYYALGMHARNTQHMLMLIADAETESNNDVREK